MTRGPGRVESSVKQEDLIDNKEECGLGQTRACRLCKHKAVTGFSQLMCGEKVPPKGLVFFFFNRK